MTKEDKKEKFNLWLEEHRGLIFKVVLSYSKSSDDHDDLFQEIALQLWKSIPLFHGKCAVTTWIYRIALNSAIAWSRKEKRHKRNISSVSEINHLLSYTTKAQNQRLVWLYEKISQLILNCKNACAYE